MLEALRAALQDRYAVDREVGAGGMATVFLAEDLKHRRQVAIKVLRAELSLSLGADRFHQEIELAARLQHPHILPVYDSGAVDQGAQQILYYVMPFVDGESLRDRLDREGPLPVETAVQYTREIASALGFAHARNIVHRDIKPENIMLSGGHAVVMDFGIARAVDAASGGARMTGVGLAIGTPAYMSPEQATASDEIDGRSDVYSLGCVLYEMLTGRMAFSGTSMQSIVTASVMGPRPRPSASREGLPAAMDQVVARALAQEPKDRYQAAPDLATDLQRAMTGALTALSPTRKRLLVAGGALLAAVLGVAIWGAYRAGASATKVAGGAEVIAVLPFTASGPNVEFLREGMVDLLSTNLNAVGGIRTVDPRSVLSRWRRESGDGGPDQAGALRVGRALDAGSVVMGSVVAAGDEVRLSAQLLSVAGEELAHAQVSGSAGDVLGLVDSLSLSLLRDIWRSSEPVPSLRVSAVTTSSVEAIREYLQGEQYYRRGAWDSATAHFIRAVELDSTFALASFRLALTYGWNGGWQTPLSQQATASAARYMDRLPARDQALIAGYRLFTRGRIESVDSMRHYVAQYPNDADGWFMLADAQYHLNGLLGLSPAELRATFDSVIVRDSTLVPALIHPLELSLALLDSTAYRRYTRLMEEVAPGEAEAYLLPGQVVFGGAPDSLLLAAMQTSQLGVQWNALMSRLYLAEPDVAGLDRLFGIMAARSAGQMRVNLLAGQASMLFGLGQVAAGRLVVDSLAAVNRQMAFGVLLAPVLAGLLPADSVTEVTAGLTRGPLDNPYVALFRATLALSEGRGAEGRRLLDASLREVPDSMEEMRALLEATRGWATVLAGDTAAGISDIRSGLRRSGNAGLNWNSSFLRLELARVMAAFPSTRAEGLRLLRYGFTLQNDPLVYPATFLLLGRVLEAAGDRTGAAQAYGRFAALWKGADASLQSRVAEAREGLARTAGEP